VTITGIRDEQVRACFLVPYPPAATDFLFDLSFVYLSSKDICLASVTVRAQVGNENPQGRKDG
jgi:hypothetical protein